MQRRPFITDDGTCNLRIPDVPRLDISKAVLLVSGALGEAHTQHGTAGCDYSLAHGVLRSIVAMCVIALSSALN